MAHLVRCWCGKIYRCDLEHAEPKRLTCFEMPHEINCPDEAIHGPQRFEFSVIKSEEFAKQAGLVWGPIADIFSDNPKKDK